MVRCGMWGSCVCWGHKGQRSLGCISRGGSRAGLVRSDLICPVPSPPLRSAPSDPAQLRPLPPTAARPRRPLLLLAILQQLPGELPLPLQAQADPFLVLPQFIPLLLQLLRRDGVGLRAGPALGGGSPHRGTAAAPAPLSPARPCPAP